MLTNEWLRGFQAALPSRRRINPQGAYDQRDDFERGREHELQRVGQEQALDAIHKFARDRLSLSSGDQSTFEQLVENLCEAFAAGEGAEDTEEQATVGSRSMTEGDPGRVRMDQPPPFRGRPQPGGGQDPLHGMDSRTRTKVLAMDAAAAVRAKQLADFERRFPEAKRIGIL
jgi:hypothetical protein